VIRRGQRRDRPPPATDLPRVGTVVEAGLVERACSWLTRVEAVDGSRLVVVAPTELRGEVVALETGGSVVVSWPAELGRIVAEGRLVTTEVDVVASWVIDVQRTEREQRRTAFRLPVMLAAVLRPVGGPSVPAEARTEDLSETGVACTVDRHEAPPLGASVEVTVAVPDHEPLVADAHVVRAEPLPPREGEPRRIRLGLELVDDDPDRRERLRRFVLDEQLRRRRPRG
jgi:c-di-GMP-binding flagellar brake protein YcgR